MVTLTSHCGNEVTVTRHKTMADAVAAKANLDQLGCGHSCTKQHVLASAETAKGRTAKPTAPAQPYWGLFDQLLADGFTLEVQGETLLVRPPEKLTPERCQVIRDNKPALMAACRIVDDVWHEAKAWKEGGRNQDDTEPLRMRSACYKCKGWSGRLEQRGQQWHVVCHACGAWNYSTDPPGELADVPNDEQESPT